MPKEVIKLDKYLKFLNESGIGKFLDSIHKKIPFEKGGRPKYNSFNLFATILYSFIWSNGTLRTIENQCKYDLRFVYLMDNEQPTYQVFANYINDYIVPNSDTIFSIITKHIFVTINLDMNTSFLDGSKFEANCNKYKFVWKPLLNLEIIIEI